MPTPAIAIKRSYEAREPGDCRRVLVDRLWPRGLTKAAAGIDDWVKQVGPTTELRKWFGHNPDKWEDFQRRYAKELDANREAWEPLLRQIQEGTQVTLVCSAKDKEHNNAVALRAYLQRQLWRGAVAEH